MIAPSIEFFSGIPETLSHVSLRRNRSTGIHSVRFSFATLKGVQGATSFTQSSFNHLRLIDEEGTIEVYPNSTKLFWGGDDADELARFDLTFELADPAHWARFMRFMHRYAEANGLEFGDRAPQPTPGG